MAMQWEPGALEASQPSVLLSSLGVRLKVSIIQRLHMTWLLSALLTWFFAPVAPSLHRRLLESSTSHPSLSPSQTYGHGKLQWLYITRRPIPPSIFFFELRTKKMIRFICFGYDLFLSSIPRSVRAVQRLFKDNAETRWAQVIVSVFQKPDRAAVAEPAEKEVAKPWRPVSTL